ncbi:disulfide bond formation protein B [Kaistia dalseonensis]|uniref:Disulfide bond formation protein DsbB n=1 Tax=Kaistia dalseonensis TaxID=410840 RepID=A0ABU0H3T4_9HYPH|nr:disulfide bond formation protein B [Kaistia dalseonensis]MCX5494370.1 disulfide bond formation protein B [Kaistia dalseonensis]MDQ0436952.1 disulfide bond formation protein DsbB [Kaistia dalseonensis]
MAATTRFRFAVLAFLLALAAILGAWSFQIFGGYAPCKLCLEQRVPYYVGLPILLIGLVLLRRGAQLPARALLVVAGLIFVVGLGLGIYHAGVEWHFWLGPADCGGGVATTGNAGDLLSQIGKTKVVSCTDAALRVLGLSFAGWNALVSAIVAALLLSAGLRRG